MAKKKKKIERDELMDKTRAAVCMVNTQRDGRESQMALDAFMAIFHPNYKGPRLKARERW